VLQTSGAYYNDRFKTGISGLGTWTQSQVTDVPTGQGFVKSLKIDCTTADASPSGEIFYYIYNQLKVKCCNKLRRELHLLKV
jgi:hypothetical protein